MDWDTMRAKIAEDGGAVVMPEDMMSQRQKQLKKTPRTGDPKQSAQVRKYCGWR